MGSTRAAGDADGPAGGGGALHARVGASAAPPAALEAAWPETDFSQHSVPLDEIHSGGVPRDAIPAITDPSMIRVEQAEGLDPREPMITLEPDGAPARAYPSATRYGTRS